MESRDIIADLDQRFVEFYDAARVTVVARQKEIALVVIVDDDLLLYRHGHAMERFSGMQPPLYNKMKTLGHMPLGVFCLLHDQAGRPLGEARLAQVTGYRDAIKAAAPALDTAEEAKTGILPGPSPVRDEVTAFLDAVIAAKTVSQDEVAEFSASLGPHIGPLLAAAAHAQLDACDAAMTEIRQSRLTQEQWANLRVLVLGPYMARQGQIFLQYFGELLDTPPLGDRRVVYFDGEDLGQAIDRLGTTMLDGEASRAIFGNHNRLHRDVLADATTDYLKKLAGLSRR